MHWALLLAGGCAFVVLVSALQNFFLQSSAPARYVVFFQEMTVAIGLLHCFSLLTRAPVSDAWAAAGILCYVASVSLFLWTIESTRGVALPRAFVDELPRDLITSGPFKWLRHPCYVAYALAWVAGPVANHSLTLAVTAILQVVLYVIAARREERRLGAVFGERYAAYRRRTLF
jgi:protein-S-isoprenylcysteine O-methyltransferase Ste14